MTRSTLNEVMLGKKVLIILMKGRKKDARGMAGETKWKARFQNSSLAKNPFSQSSLLM